MSDYMPFPDMEQLNRAGPAFTCHYDYMGRSQEPAPLILPMPLSESRRISPFIQYHVIPCGPPTSYLELPDTTVAFYRVLLLPIDHAMPCRTCDANYEYMSYFDRRINDLRLRNAQNNIPYGFYQQSEDEVVPIYHPHLQYCDNIFNLPNAHPNWRSASSVQNNQPINNPTIHSNAVNDYFIDLVGSNVSPINLNWNRSAANNFNPDGTPTTTNNQPNVITNHHPHIQAPPTVTIHHPSSSTSTPIYISNMSNPNPTINPNFISPKPFQNVNVPINHHFTFPNEPTQINNVPNMNKPMPPENLFPNFNNYQAQAHPINVKHVSPKNENLPNLRDPTANRPPHVNEPVPTMAHINFNNACPPKIDNKNLNMNKQDQTYDNFGPTRMKNDSLNNFNVQTNKNPNFKVPKQEVLHHQNVNNAHPTMIPHQNMKVPKFELVYHPNLKDPNLRRFQPTAKISRYEPLHNPNLRHPNLPSNHPSNLNISHPKWNQPHQPHPNFNVPKQNIVNPQNLNDPYKPAIHHFNFNNPTASVNSQPNGPSSSETQQSDVNLHFPTPNNQANFIDYDSLSFFSSQPILSNTNGTNNFMNQTHMNNQNVTHNQPQQSGTNSWQQSQINLPNFNFHINHQPRYINIQQRIQRPRISLNRNLDPGNRDSQPNLLGNDIFTHEGPRPLFTEHPNRDTTNPRAYYQFNY